jgi:hypothetical protein
LGGEPRAAHLPARQIATLEEIIHRVRPRPSEIGRLDGHPGRQGSARQISPACACVTVMEQPSHPQGSGNVNTMAESIPQTDRPMCHLQNYLGSWPLLVMCLCGISDHSLLLYLMRPYTCL